MLAPARVVRSVVHPKIQEETPVADQPYTPQNRTDEEGSPEGTPKQTPQGRAEENDEKVEEGRPGNG